MYWITSTKDSGYKKAVFITNNLLFCNVFATIIKNIYIRRMNFHFITCFIVILCSFSFSLESGRSLFRKINSRQPVITMKSKKNPKKKFTRSDWYYYKDPLFTVFDENFFFSHLLPKNGITIYHDNTNAAHISFDELNIMLETLVSEVKKEKNEYTYFTLIKNKNFNRKKKCGLLIVKCKKYPLIIKLFIEHPSTLINPLCKGFENRIFHFMGHGSNRHLAGLTRISNLERLKEKIKKSDWKIILPRKWFWIPRDPKWIEISGENIEKNTILTTTIPGIYAIIADELKENKTYAISSTQRHEIVMKFCNDMQVTIDPHIDNFMVEKKDGVLSIAIVDTEHFQTLVGMQEDIRFQNYTEWYVTLSGKAIKDFFFTSKADHLKCLEKRTI